MSDADPARGCAMGFLIAGLLWVLFFLALAILVTVIARSIHVPA
jgi:hypothetical protein